MRVAAANAVSLAELLNGLLAHYPAALEDVKLLDWQVPPATLAALARFCRVPAGTLRALDLQHRIPGPQPVLLRFCQGDTGAPSSVKLDTDDFCHEWRVRYGYCGPCLATQAVPHIRWDWCLAALIRCRAHRTALQDGCHHCGHWDPLGFTPGFTAGPARCGSCGLYLAPQAESQDVPGEPALEDAIADAYRDVLRGVAPHPSLLGKVTAKEFRHFVHDMLGVLANCVGRAPEYLTWADIDRHELMQIVGDLVRTAAPSPDVLRRRRRHSRALVLWGVLLQVMRPDEGEDLQGRTVRWPLALRRRWNSALLRSQRRSWPDTPFTGPFHIDPQANAQALVAAYGLRNGESRQSSV